MRVLIIDDHPLTCQGLCALLLAHYKEANVHLAHTALAARLALQSLPTPDWIFLDINLQDDVQHALFHELCKSAWIERTILISADPGHRLIRTALASGARGFIPKAAAPEQVLTGFAAILAGELYLPPDMSMPWQQESDASTRGLSPRLRQVQDLLLRGASNKLIARDLNLSGHTVKEYVSSVLTFHSVASRLELVLLIGRK